MDNMNNTNNMNNNTQQDKNDKNDNKKVVSYVVAIVLVLLVIVGVGLIAINIFKPDISTKKENNTTNSSSGYNSVFDLPTTSYKQIIYLYPEEETEISVKLNNKDNITCSYPKYIDGWNVVAKPNGDLTYVEDGKKLYSLYYESENEKNYKVEEDGFVVKGEDTAEFLEEKLEILGLNYKEKEEFIVYWLPKLEANKYNYIRFATIDEINQNMKLEFSKKPDTLIRVLMTYKGLDKPIEVKEQELETPERKGFVAVEWGGSEIK